MPSACRIHGLRALARLVAVLLLPLGSPLAQAAMNLEYTWAHIVDGVVVLSLIHI